MAKKETKAPIRPLGDKVLLKDSSKKNEERKLKSGIILPSSVKDDGGTKRGVVVAVGPGKYEDGELRRVSLEVGQEVLFSWGDEIKIDGETYHLVSESSILGIVE